MVDDLSTWYLRRSRPRFWNDRAPGDRRQANDTLSFTLLGLARLIAPFAPSTAEHVLQEVGGGGYRSAEGSVHLSNWPESSGALEPALEAAMDRVRSEVEIGRELRQRVGVKSRIPLERFILVGAPPPEALGSEADRLLADELNVRQVERIGPEELGRFPEADFERTAGEGGTVVALLPRRPTAELRREGLVREALRRLQSLRKEAQLSFLDHVRVEIGADGELLEAIEGARERITEELLAVSITLGVPAPPERAKFRTWEIDGMTLYARLERSAA